jgi:hypothetical protein
MMSESVHVLIATPPEPQFAVRIEAADPRGARPLPGHGPGITPILAGPAGGLRVQPGPAGHTGLTEAALQQLTAPGLELQ